jgi:chlorobactene lauroyltransferase
MNDPAPFLPAYKHGWPRRLVDLLIQRRFRSRFFAVRVQGLDRLRSSLQVEPGGTLFLANHSGWWDLFLVHLLNETIPVDGYGMMEHANLKRFSFFRRIGAFSIDRSNPASVRASIAYARALLSRPEAGVWIFPQGSIVGNDVRPLGFRPGFRLLIRKASRLRVVAVAFRYEFWQDERPEIFVRFGEPRWVDGGEAVTAVSDWEHALTAELDALRDDVVAQRTDRFEPLLSGQPSISERYARFRARLRGESD